MRRRPRLPGTFALSKASWALSSHPSPAKHNWGGLRWPQSGPSRPHSPIWAQYPGLVWARPTPASATLFRVSLEGWQPMYTLVGPSGAPIRTYSTGFIMRLYGGQGKRLRRDVARAPVSMSFFKRYLPPKGAGELRLGVCQGYKRRYDYFLQSALAPFAASHLDGLTMATRTLLKQYCWRRVAPIKKRIRKRLGIRSK